MASSKQTSIVMIKLTKPSNQNAIVKIKWNNDTNAQLEIALLQEADLPVEYTADVDFKSMEAIASANSLGQSPTEVITEFKQALSAPSSHHEFIYEIDGDKFKCSKTKDGFQLLYGSVQLKLKSGICANMMLHLMQINEDLKQKYDEKCAELGKCKNDYGKLKEEHDTYVDDNNVLNRENLTKFVQLLNEKKLKISKLESELSTLKESQDDYLAILSQESNNIATDDEISATAPKRSNDLFNVKLPKRTKATNNNTTQATAQTAHAKEVPDNMVQAVPVSSTSALHQSQTSANIWDVDTQDLLDQI